MRSSSASRAITIRQDADHRDGQQRERHRHERELPPDVQFQRHHLSPVTLITADRVVHITGRHVRDRARHTRHEPQHRARRSLRRRRRQALGHRLLHPVLRHLAHRPIQHLLSKTPRRIAAVLSQSTGTIGSACGHIRDCFMKMRRSSATGSVFTGFALFTMMTNGTGSAWTAPPSTERPAAPPAEVDASRQIIRRRTPPPSQTR